RPRDFDRGCAARRSAILHPKDTAGAAAEHRHAGDAGLGSAHYGVRAQRGGSADCTTASAAAAVSWLSSPRALIRDQRAQRRIRYDDLTVRWRRLCLSRAWRRHGPDRTTQARSATGWRRQPYIKEVVADFSGRKIEVILDNLNMQNVA